MIVGGLTWGVLRLFGLHLRPIDCLLFGALISPTDPIAVLALLKRIGAPKRLEIQIAGESLFNDGVGVVVFLGLLEIATGHEQLRPGFLRRALRSRGHRRGPLRPARSAWSFIGCSNRWTTTAWRSCSRWRWSPAAMLWPKPWASPAPIAMVVAGLLIGNHGRSFAMSPTTTEHIDRFWGLLDEFLNAVLFVMIGMEVLVLTFTARYLLAGARDVAIVLLARLISVGVPIWLLRRWERFEAVHDPDPDLGRIARRYLGRPGPVLPEPIDGAERAHPGDHPRDHLRRRCLLDPRPGIDDRHR